MEHAGEAASGIRLEGVQGPGPHLRVIIVMSK